MIKKLFFLWLFFSACHAMEQGAARSVRADVVTRTELAVAAYEREHTKFHENYNIKWCLYFGCILPIVFPCWIATCCQDRAYLKKLRTQALASGSPLPSEQFSIDTQPSVSTKKFCRFCCCCPIRVSPTYSVDDNGLAVQGRQT